MFHGDSFIDRLEASRLTLTASSGNFATIEGGSMKFFVATVSMLVGFSAHACPDVSGKYGGYCTQQNTCFGDRTVFYGVEIVQRSCDEVQIADVAYNGEVAFKRTYLIDREAVERGLGSLLVSTVLSYTSDGLVKTEKSGYDLSSPRVMSVDVLKKGGVSGGHFLEVNFEGSTKKCKAKINCQIPAL